MAPGTSAVAVGGPAGRVPGREPVVERGDRHARRPRRARARGARAAACRRTRAAAWPRRSSGRRPPRRTARRPRAGSVPAAPSAVSRSKRAARGEARQREPLEDAGEAALRRPRRLAGERGRLRAGALGPGAVGGGGAGALGRQVGQLAVAPGAAGCSSIGLLQLGRGGEREQEREPGRLLDVGLGGHLGIRARAARGARWPAASAAARRSASAVARRPGTSGLR